VFQIGITGETVKKCLNRLGCNTGRSEIKKPKIILKEELVK
jgi:hypothetical protein